jgi:hypothetical protein
VANIGDLFIGGHTPVVSTALEPSHRLLATGPGALYDLTVLNFNASARLVLVIDSNSLTAPTTIDGVSNRLIWSFPVAGLSTTPGPLAAAWEIPPMRFLNGLWVALSTTLTTPFTIVAAGNDGFFSALVGLS